MASPSGVLLVIATSSAGMVVASTQSLHRCAMMPRIGSLEIAPGKLASLNVGEELCLFRARSGGHSFSAKRIAQRPHAFLLSGVLTYAECDYLMAQAALRGMHSAETTGRTDNRKHCDVCTLRPADSPMLEALTADICECLLTEGARGPGGGCEDLHLLRYAPGGEFKLHFDAHARLNTGTDRSLLPKWLWGDVVPAWQLRTGTGRA